MVEEAGLRCPRCSSGACASYHGSYLRKRVFDLITGDSFEDVPILRVRLCDGSTPSLIPAALWRGRSTVGSVLQAVIWRLQEGTTGASERISQRGDGEAVPDESTLRRWNQQVRSRLVGSAMAAVGPALKLSWSDADDEAAQLQDLLARLSPAVLLAFRADFGHAVLDKPQPARVQSQPRSVACPIAARLARTLPHEPPSATADQGARSTLSQPRRPRPPPPP